METSLVDRWLPKPEVLVVDDASVAIARARVRDAGAGLPTEIVETMALLASELATNQLRHASGGRFSVTRIERAGVAGLELVAADRGRGLVNLEAALDGKTAGAGSLGAGLAAVFRMADEVDVDVRVGEGTCIRARRFVTSPRDRSEVGIFGAPCPGETVSGDDSAFVRGDDGALFVAVADGLGHGAPARAASSLAIGAALHAARAGVVDVLRAADAAVRGSRGATMSVLDHDARASTLRHAGLGDVSARVCSHGRWSKLAGQPGMLAAAGERSIRVDVNATTSGDFILVASDGLVTSAADAIRVERHPFLLAQQLATAHRRSTDDVIVCVARLL